MFESKSTYELKLIASGSHYSYSTGFHRRSVSAYAREELERRGYDTENHYQYFDSNNPKER